MIETDGLKVTSARICLNAVYVTPYRVIEAEKATIGKEINEANADAAGAAAVADAQPMSGNAHMVQIAKTLVKRCIMACG